MKNKTVILNIVCFLLIIYITILSISFNLHMASNNNLSMVYLIMSTVTSFAVIGFMFTLNFGYLLIMIESV